LGKEISAVVTSQNSARRLRRNVSCQHCCGER